MFDMSRGLLFSALLQLVALPSWAAGLDDPPLVDVARAKVVAPGITVIVDPRINYVPNIGIIEGSDAVLVVDTGLGPENGARVWNHVRKLAGNRRIYLTTTHFHPEHSFGASAFDPRASTYMLNKAQAEELKEKGPSYLKLFSSFGPEVDAALRDTTFIDPAETYVKARTVELGGRKVVLRAMPAHTRGDQIVYVPDSGVVFLGDLVEDRFFPIFPDADSHGAKWIEVTRAIQALKPKIVVPGHGDLGDVEMVKRTHDYLVEVDSLVAAEVKKKRNQQDITRELVPVLEERYPDWDNAVFIPYQIAVFYAEITGTEVKLPALQEDLGAK